MRPLDPLADRSTVVRLLKGAPAAEARSEIARLEGEGLVGLAAAAWIFAQGALTLLNKDPAGTPAEWSRLDDFVFIVRRRTLSLGSGGDVADEARNALLGAALGGNGELLIVMLPVLGIA